MNPYLTSITAQLHREDLLREAERERFAAAALHPHAWRNRLGGVLIRAGRVLADEPPPPAPARSRHRTRVA